MIAMNLKNTTWLITLGSLLSAGALLTPRKGHSAEAVGDSAKTAPTIVFTSPRIGDTDVDPGLKEITVTFDKDMQEGFSWTGGGPNYPPIPEGEKPHWSDKRTCVLPVKLDAGHYYRVGINAPSYKNFRSADGVPVEPSAIFFTTKGGSPQRNNAKPVIVSLEPKNGAHDVDPNLTELRVTFNVPMAGSYSWCGSGPQFPGDREGKKPYWTEDRKTCVLPVQLKPGWEFQLGINSRSFKGFKSASGIPVDPVLYTFKTK